MAGVTHDLSSLLFSEKRDFLVRNNGDQVKINELIGKNIALYFSASWCPPCHRFTPILEEVYKAVASKQDFEVVFISSDRDEESYNSYFSKMPWLSIPFLDLDTRKRLRELFHVRGIPNLVILDSIGKVSTIDGVRLVREYGAQSYPFTLEQINYLKEKEEDDKKNQTISSILVSESRDYVLSNDGKKIPVSELEGKVVGLYFSVHDFPPCHEFNSILLNIYKKLEAKGEKFEVVLISLDREEENFYKALKSMPWLALPFKDKITEKLARYFEFKDLPTFVIIGQDGKTSNLNAVELIEEHGILSYPFTPEKVAELDEIEKAKLETQTLESLLVSEESDFVVDKNGAKVPVSELVGKNILFYFSAHWCPPCHSFMPKLIQVYHEIKSKNNHALEIIFVSKDRDPSSFEEFFSGMPWLALPFQDPREKFLERRFKVSSIPTLVAVGPTGQTVNTKVRELVTAHGADAYPFTDKHVKDLEDRIEEEKKVKEGWVCEGDVCRRA